MSNELIVTAIDEYGAFVRNLGPANFKAEVHGHPIPILSSGVNMRPGRVVILLDSSGSMNAENSRLLARAAAIDAVQSLNPSTQLSVVVFADEPKALATFGTSRASIIKVLNTIDWGKRYGKGHTALLDAILAAAKLLDPPQLGDAIYIITDGGDNTSHSRFPQVQDELLSKGIRLFAFLIYNLGPPSVEEQRGPSEIWNLANATGGWSLGYRSPTLAKNPYAAPNIQEPSPAQPLYEQVNNFYTVRLGGLNTFSKPEKWKLEIRGEEGINPKRIHLQYPSRLLPCARSLSAK
ncbi:MAG TPA: VWA domain-containing protein [Terriglobales bacterium]|nr:VWA domain-containing protein [Terriglobales bacterium]